MRTLYVTLLGLVCSQLFGEEQRFGQTGGTSVTSEFAEVDGEMVEVFTLISTELRIAGKSIHKEFDGKQLGLETVLTEITRTEKWCQGMDGREVTLRIDSYLLGDDRRFSKKMSSIMVKGDDVVSDPYSQRIYVTEYGCCDAPTMVFTYNAVTGKLIETRKKESS